MTSSSPTPCSMCGQRFGDAQSIQICSACYQVLLAAGSVSVGVTGEFKIPTMLPHPGAEIPTAQAVDQVRCHWCYRDAAEVKKLLSRGNVHICNQCIALSVDILQAELGEDWRS